jgi:hypothetical protein
MSYPRLVTNHHWLRSSFSLSAKMIPIFTILWERATAQRQFWQQVSLKAFSSGVFRVTFILKPSSSYCEMFPTAPELVTVTSSKVRAGWKEVWTSEDVQKRCSSSHCIPLQSPHLLPPAQRKVEDVVFSTQEVALSGHSEDFLCVL